VVLVWILNNKGEFLITQRAPTKGFPNMWECTGGFVTAGDDSKTAAIREAKEETGLTVAPENGKCVIQYTDEANRHYDIYLFRQDFDIKEVTLQEGETVAAKFATPNEIREKIKSGKFLSTEHFEDLMKHIDKAGAI
jgi:8-oxo-dGTP pyrophosphatase MutT (NUDIX family)